MTPKRTRAFPDVPTVAESGLPGFELTLTYGVIANLVFGQVTDISGFGGISGIQTPGLIGSATASGS